MNTLYLCIARKKTQRPITSKLRRQVRWAFVCWCFLQLQCFSNLASKESMHSRAPRSKFMPCNKCKHFCKVHAPFSINYTVYASDQRVTMCSISTLFFIFMWRRNVHSSCNLKHSLICSTWFIAWHSSLTLPQLQLHYHRVGQNNNKTNNNCSIFCCCSSFAVVLLLLLPFRRIPHRWKWA